jgi:hypothetical protein
VTRHELGARIGEQCRTGHQTRRQSNPLPGLFPVHVEAEVVDLVPGLPRDQYAQTWVRGRSE